MKRPRQDNAINASSMADIAFLLLIFFLVTTTIDYDKGIMHLLPRLQQEEPITNQSHARNTLVVLVNGKDQLMINGEPMPTSQLRQTVKDFIDNHGRNPKFSDNPTVAIVSLQNDKGTSYGIYITVQNELKGAYRELRDAYALKRFGKTFNELREAKSALAEEVTKAYPMRLSEAEPYAVAE